MENVYGVVGKTVTVEDFKKYQREGFETIQSDLLQYNNKPFQIVRALTSEEVDMVSAPMFTIKFEDGFESDAFMDEIFTSNVFDELIRDENLVR